MQILDGFFWVKPENIGFATCMKNIGLQFASSDIFHVAHPIFSGITLKPSNIVSNLVKVIRTLTTTHTQTMMGFEVTMGSLGSKSEKGHSCEKYENSYHIKTNYVILYYSQSFKKVNGDLVILPHLMGSKVKVSYFKKMKKMFQPKQIT